jgi:hypothetical protein
MRDNGIVPVICPTCKIVLAGSAKAAAIGYCAWGCFRYFWLGGAVWLEAWLAEP